MISFTLSRPDDEVLQAKRGTTLGNFIKVFPLIITPLFSPNNLFNFIGKRWERRKVDKVDISQLLNYSAILRSHNRIDCRHKMSFKYKLK